MRSGEVVAAPRQRGKAFDARQRYMSLVSSAYGRTIRRQKAPPVTLDEQFRTGKVEAMSLLAAGLRQFETAGQGGPGDPRDRARTSACEGLAAGRRAVVVRMCGCAQGVRRVCAPTLTR